MNSIVIVGAGISGLYAAFLLKKSISDIDIKILESSDRIGGRIYSKVEEDTFFELGAEQIHGRNHIFFELLEYLKIKVYPDSGDYYYFWKDQLIDEDHSHSVPELLQAKRFFNSFENYDGPTENLKDYLNEKGYMSSESEHLFQGFAAEYGTDLDSLEIQSLVNEERLWTSGEKNYHLKGPMNQIIDFFKQELSDNIILNTEVEKIEYSNDLIKIQCKDSKSFTADSCIISTSLGILKQDKITFSPSLPPPHKNAIEQLGFDRGFKFLLQFSEKFWDKDTREIIGGQIAPLYLFSDQEQPVVCAYMMGKNAKILETSSKAYIERLFVDELNLMFNRRDLGLLIQKSIFHDWGNDPHTLGTYSYAVPHSLKLRENLSKPIENKLFFIGEACNSEGHAATIQGAMESAEKSCEIILSIYNENNL
ncbi:flavin monoamine oxidase family protein [Sediminitomix flava]|uniref:Tryptophan 2-monooxygenase n=1 Tax=Sediminitomix flava TaxID=379075 RepID=A0A315Z790_SEDFL|nr:NAD(P)/FAD-dependent oxidoreductase [Sediminitomix flava]PWJ40203.1 monoamine oxidase [Sediminitomix flava]